LVLASAPDPDNGESAITTPDPTALVASRRHVGPREIEFKRTMNSIMAVYWLVSDNYESFVRGQQSPEKLRKSSWTDAREWIMDACGLNNPEIVDTIFVLLVVRFCGLERPELVPSFGRLSDEMKSIVMQIFEMTFNFGQFIQCENLPVHLNGLKDFVVDHGINKSLRRLNIYLAYWFFQMCGLLGAKSDEGSLFMKNIPWCNFKLGVDILTESLLSDPVDVIYEKMVIRKSAALLHSFQNRQVSAICRLYNLARISRESDARKLDTAFASLLDDEKNDLVQYLNRGSHDDHAIMLVYAPAFLENMRMNGTIDPVAQLKMLWKVYRAVDEHRYDRKTITANVREAAVWARDVQFSDSINQLNEFEVQVIPNQDEYIVVIIPFRH
jgi:hypothetical protein